MSGRKDSHIEQQVIPKHNNERNEGILNKNQTTYSSKSEL